MHTQQQTNMQALLCLVMPWVFPWKQLAPGTCEGKTSALLQWKIPNVMMLKLR
jgi:hypothetical protein